MERLGQALPPELEELVGALALKLEDYQLKSYIDFYPLDPREGRDYVVSVEEGHYGN